MNQSKMSTQAEMSTRIDTLQEQVDQLSQTNDQLARDNARLVSLDNILLPEAAQHRARRRVPRRDGAEAA